MDLGRLSEVLQLVFRNHTADERFYDLLENKHLWSVFIEVSHDSVFQERLVLLQDFTELMLYIFSPRRQIEKDFLKYGGFNQMRYEEFMEFVSVNPPASFFEEETCQ
jgi:hypothetical protein